MSQFSNALFDKSIQDIVDEERKLGKIVNFGLIYGMGVAKFCLTTAKKHNIYLSKAEASQFREKFFLLYRGVTAYHQRFDGSGKQELGSVTVSTVGAESGVRGLDRLSTNCSIIPFRAPMPLLSNRRSLCWILLC